MKNQEKFVFVRMGAIGDVIHCLPLVKHLRKRNPQAHIQFVVGSNQLKDLLDSFCPYIDQVYAVNQRSVFNKPFKLKLCDYDKALLQKMKEQKIDHLVYLHSNVFKAWMLRLRLGAKDLSVYKPVRGMHAVENFANLLYPRAEFDELEHKVLISYFKQEPQNYICLVPGVGKLRPSRAYPLIKWFAFIENVLDLDNKICIKILGGPDELELKDKLDDELNQLQESKKARVENLIGQTSLTKLALVLLQSKKLYSADTGILHIAAALDIPTRSVFSITSPKRFGPYHPNADVLVAPDCFCESSFTNKPKHCNKLKDGYASCMWQVDI